MRSIEHVQITLWNSTVTHVVSNVVVRTRFPTLTSDAGCAALPLKIACFIWLLRVLNAVGVVLKCCQLEGMALTRREGRKVLQPIVEDDVEERVARLESDVAHIRSDIGVMKTDIRELRQSVDGVKDAVAGVRIEIKDSSVHLERKILQSQIWGLFVAAAILGVLARGFHWI
jgi:hypothetical protein